MSDAPKRIWLGGDQTPYRRDWFDWLPEDDREGSSEYVRADLYEALTAERDAIMAAGNHSLSCNFWKWDWRFSWDQTDCTCPLRNWQPEPPQEKSDE